MSRRRFILALLALASSTALAGEGDQALITYQVAVGNRQVSGASRTLEWSATPLGQESAHVRLLVPVASFDSGHPGFDSMLRTALEARRYPFIEVEGTASRGHFEGTILVRGVSRPLSLDPSIVRLGDRVIATASFIITLQDFDVSLPGTGGRLAIDFVAALSMDPRAVHAAGALNPG